MLRRLVLTGLLVVVGCAGAYAAEPVKLDGFSLDGWTVAEGPKTWVGDSVREKIGDLVVVHQGYGLITSQWLLLKRGEEGLDVFVFTYDSPANAFGLFTVVRRTVMPAGGAEPVGIGDESAFHPAGELAAWVGQSAIVLTSVGAKVPDKDAFLAVARRLADQATGGADKPELVKTLPIEGLANESILYCHYRQALDQVFHVGEENLLGLGQDVKVPTQVEAVFAQYTLSDRPHQVIALRYPDGAAAATAAEAFGKKMAAEAKSDRAEGSWRDFGLRNGKHTLLYQSGRLVVISPEATAVEEVKDSIRSLSAGVNPPPQPPMAFG